MSYRGWTQQLAWSVDTPYPPCKTSTTPANRAPQASEVLPKALSSQLSNAGLREEACILDLAMVPSLAPCPPSGGEGACHVRPQHC
jgi:hypothetical protein